MPLKTVELTSTSAEQTFAIGYSLGTNARNGDVFALVGELGAGKTVLTKGLAQGFGVPSHCVITSPTFTLINEYEGERGVLFHLDIYRLAKSTDLTDIGAEEMLGSERGIAVVEWADKMSEAMPEGTIFIRISATDESSRKLVIAAPEHFPLATIG
ncbi:MAG: tRNA (adenosine(37)-N6)-threonylcarbamoyltransferase complex ATPase subunit type 1 TsaE [Deltaproteobacteria bacterium]|jgi:tRNA threonylcarbamoyladenosine biosynthesis protein TsaE|nr:tRNA (adenosine(37)-N6)-threonylcarbamoyltransferase complex ATPase subunit type 1 TsaE [Deltaproteobacteria bacterium]